MEHMVAYCGLVCTECEAYLATQADDMEALERLAKKAREEYGVTDATVESTRCDGCLPQIGRKNSYCAVCEIRACGTARNVVNCGECMEYSACEKIKDFMAMVPQAKIVLDEIAASKMG